ncbi:MAG TPA: hypothetical protein VLE20_15595, partial [Blastocatellia bacterium]|nr:hypothetical protein [Blastocatellia bacterium]
PRAARPQEAAAPRDRVLPPRLFFYRPDDFVRSALAAFIRSPAYFYESPWDDFRFNYYRGRTARRQPAS